jgi:hypothetical protein
MYCDSKYKNDMDMGDLYVKLRVIDYRGENFHDYVNIKEEMVDTYMKLYFENVIDKLPPTDSCYYKIRQHYIEHNGIEPPKEISLVIGWDKDTSNKIFSFRT